MDGGEEVGSGGSYPEQMGWGREFLEACQGDGGGKIFGVGPGNPAVVA